MNHLRKFNESHTNLLQVCKDVFADLIDDYNVEIDDTTDDVDREVYVYVPYTNSPDTNNFDTLFNSKRETFTLMQNLKIAIDRLKDEYPKLSVVVGMEDDDLIRLEISIDEMIEGDFYKLNTDSKFVHLDLYGLRKILNLPQFVSIRSYGQVNNHRVIRFIFNDNYPTYDRIKDKLINDFSDLEIDGEKLNVDISWNHPYPGQISKYLFARSSNDHRRDNEIRFSLNNKFKYEI